jgi:hypothetical protein
MKGYKAFYYDWTCMNSFQYEIGKIYEMDQNEIQMCKKGFHFCQVPLSVHNYNPGYTNGCKYAEIKASGKILEDNDKCVCSRIEIIKELSLEQIRDLSSGLFIKIDGTKRYYLNGQLHCSNGPAIEYVNGIKEWWVHGERHRLDGPAIEDCNGTNEWWIVGNRDRKDGPAIENVNGRKEWWVNGERHRFDGPAIEDCTGRKEWWVHGERHRLDGPAIEDCNGTKEWWIVGKKR